MCPWAKGIRQEFPSLNREGLGHRFQIAVDKTLISPSTRSIIAENNAATILIDLSMSDQTLSDTEGFLERPSWTLTAEELESVLPVGLGKLTQRSSGRHAVDEIISPSHP